MSAGSSVSSEITFTSVGGGVLSGTVLVPDVASLTSGLVLVGGSGAADRHNGGYFDAVGDSLVTSGIPILVYDKRGVGGSSGEWAPATVDDLAADAAAALDALAAHLGIAPSAVGLFGHSEGGWVALRVVSRLRRPRHLILNSCPAVPFLRAEVAALTNAGVAARIASQAFERLADLAQAGADHTAAANFIDGYAGTPLHSALAKADFELNAMTWAQLKAWVTYDPTEDIIGLRIPTLATFGERDGLTPVADSIAALRRHNRAVSVATFADGDHRLQTGARFADGYLDTLIEWCNQYGYEGLA